QGRYRIFDGSLQRACGYGDMAVLLRSRTHLTSFEDALRRADIPFVVVKGIGFYNTPEIAILKDLLFFLIDSADDYSLFNVLRSPLFGVDYGSLVELIKDTVPGNLPLSRVYAALDSRSRKGGSEVPLQTSLWNEGPDAGEERLREIFGSLNRWLKKAREIPYAMVLEEILADSGVWGCFHEKQRYRNVKKFISLIEEFESKGFTGLEIREKIMRASTRADEPKANVTTEGMNAVRLMTIHASKGLQFPMVFLPCLDEENKARVGNSIVMDEDGDRIVIGYEDDSEIRKTLPLFRKEREKTLEEEKRLFYVAATRAMDYLCMSGVVRKERFSGKLSYLADAFHLAPDERDPKTELFTITRVTAKDLAMSPSPSVYRSPHGVAPESSIERETVFINPLDYKPSSLWLDVTEEVDSVRRKHGEDWVILGRSFHRLFEGISKGAVDMGSVETKILDILRSETMSDGALGAMKEIILSDIRKLDVSGYLREIILPRDQSFAELPFILERDDTIYRGRIDRVIIRGAAALLYDYKTYPVKDAEIPGLREHYSFQMNIYRQAVENLFNLRTRAYLFFTHERKLVEV
ncbi:MAG TPA: 3'-5' exonuclease, partial [Thermodesulfovibrionales bacterium]|nr:3'-5' exonuclease [Thermodesulfovibrionales bacterium]